MYMRREIALRMYIDQFLFSDTGITAVDSLERTAVTDEMLGSGKYVLFTETPLQAMHHTSRILPYDIAIFRIGLVGPAPAVIPRDSHYRCKCPVEPGGGNFPCRDPAYPADQFGIAGSSETDIVGKDGRSPHIIVSMYRVSTPNDRNTYRGITHR